MNDIALLIIDMQKAMFARANHLPYRGEEVLQNIQALLAEARKRDVPVIFVQHEAGGAFRPGSATWEIREELKPAPEEPVVHKTRLDAFYHTNLQEVLAQRQIHSLIVTGMQSDFCVKQTCLGARAHGNAITLVSDAHTTFSSLFIPAQRIVARINQTLEANGISLRQTADVLK